MKKKEGKKGGFGKSGGGKAGMGKHPSGVIEPHLTEGMVGKKGMK